MTTPAVEEYLELLFRENAADEPVRPAALARGLGVSTAAVAKATQEQEEPDPDA
jgi:Mn-dependent DtxR family transcriptional regulator